MSTRFKYFIFLTFLAVFFSFCTKPPYADTGYSPYKPLLMPRGELETAVKLLPPQDIDTVFKIVISGNKIFIGEIYKGIHILNGVASSPVNEAFVAVPGIIDFAVNDSLIYANSAVDLVTIRIADGSVVDRQREVFPELIPPDALEPNPQFVRGLRPDSTEIVAWVKNPSYDQDTNNVLVPNYLLEIEGSYLYGLIGASLIVYDISSGLPRYLVLQKVNYNFNYAMRLLPDYGLFISNSNLGVYAFEAADNLSYKNEYTGINIATYFDIWHTDAGYYLVASFHYFPLYWILYNQLEIYYMGEFDRAVLDTVIKLTYPLDVRFRDSLLFVCDRGIKIFKQDSTYALVKYYTADAQKMYFADSLLITLGEQSITSYKVNNDSLHPLWSLPISMSWIIK